MDTKRQEVQGIVEEALPNTLFRVTLESGDTILTYLAGKCVCIAYAFSSGIRLLSNLTNTEEKGVS